MAATLDGAERRSLGTATRRGRHVTADKELAQTAEVQRQLLPPAIHWGPFVEVAASTRPCRVLGGDFFDYVSTGHEFRVVLGDACGKGAPAALQAALVQGGLSIEADADGGPANIVAHLNRALCRRAIAARYVTLFCGIITPDNRLTYCNAGHCWPLLVNHRSTKRLSAGGRPLGIFSDAIYEEESVTLENGDTVVAFSDGITEAHNRRQGSADFGDKRILEIVKEQPDAAASAILERLLSKVQEFACSAPPRDDITAVVVRYLGGKAESPR